MPVDLTSALQKCAEFKLVAKAAASLNRLMAKAGPWRLKIEGQYVYFNTIDRLIILLLYRATSAEKKELEFWKSLCREAKVVMDVGANLGTYAFAASSLVADGGRVIAVEAAPGLCELLRLGAEANHCANLRIINAAVTDQSGPVKFFMRPEHAGAGQLRAEGEGRECVEVPGLTLDEIAGDGTKVDLIKMDIEGAEALATQGMELVLAGNTKIKVISEFLIRGLKRFGMDPVDYLQFWRDRGFIIYQIGEGDFSLTEMVDNQSVMRAAKSRRYLNLFFSRERHHCS